MFFSYNWLQTYFKTKLPKPKELADLLTIYSFEVGEVKRLGNDFILDIDILPNRASDCFSHLGIAREISLILGLNYRLSTPRIKENKKLKTKNFLSVEVKNEIDCPRYTARVVTDIKVSSSPKWIRERLESCGLQSINNIVDIVNYVMLETGQPLHVFDFDKILGQKIIVRRAKEGEKIITLDNKTYSLDKDILLIADSKDPLAIAGIKGGKKAEVKETTKNIILESANFDKRVIRLGSKKLNLKTDASWRFEQGIDANLTKMAINRAVYLIQKITNGKVAEGLIDFYPKKVFPKRIKLDLNYLESLLGIKIPAKEIKSILKKLGFKIEKIKTHQLLVTVPTWRLDISIPEDLIEEVGRIYGYQKIPSVFPTAVLIPPKRNLEIFWEEMIKDILKEAGLSEVYNYSFVSQKEIELFGFQSCLELKNPISLDYQYLRPSLIPNLLKNIQKNQDFFKEIKIFEIGKIFRENKNQKKFKKTLSKRKGKDERAEKFIEKKMLTGAITGDSFYTAKGIIDLLMNKIGIANVWYDEFQPTPEESEMKIWNPRKSAEIKVNSQEIGFLGEISPEIIEHLKINNKVVIFDFDFEKLTKLASEEVVYRPISRYPSAVRDLAVLVPRSVRLEEVLNKIETVGSSLIRDIDLFDIYEGEELPEGKKNFAFHIIYQAEDRTLTSEEIDKIQNKIIKVLEQNPEWEVRK